MMDGMLQDVRLAARSAIRRPGFAAVTVLTLAVGIGGNTATYSVVEAVLLRPMPIPNADRLVWVWGREFNGSPGASVSPPDYLDYVAGATAFESLAAYASFGEFGVYAEGERPVELSVRAVTPDFFETLGSAPAVGRGFTEDEGVASEPQVAVLSHGAWGRLFGFGQGVVGGELRLDDRSYTVVGVLPEGPTFPANTDVFIPIPFGADGYDSRASHFLRPIGLLREGGSLDEAQRTLDIVSARLEAAFPETNDGWYAIAAPLQTVFTGAVRPRLLLFLAAVGLVLLIACGNVANLLFARTMARRGELSVRSALGASRSRITRQLLTESLLISLVAAALGVLLAQFGIEALERLQPGNIPRLDEVRVDGSVLGFTLVVAVGVGLLFGSLPALGLTSRDLTLGLSAGARTSGGRAGRIRGVLIGAQVALSFILLTGALLLSRSFSELRGVDPGFDPQGVVAITVGFPGPDAMSAAAVSATLDRMTARLEALPGVDRAGRATALPFSGQGGDTYVYAEGRPPEQIRNIQNTALIRSVDEGYFETLRVPLLRGRVFDRSDDTDAPLRVVVNEALALSLFPDEDPVGRRMMVLLDTTRAAEVIGVVADTRQFALSAPAQREFFLSQRQRPSRSVRVLVRGADGAAPPMTAFREVLWEVDPTQPLTRASELESMVASSLAPGRFQAILVGLFSGFAVLLAAVGLYGLLAEGVSQRRRELGVRLALGEDRSSVVRAVVGRGLRLATLGSAAGAVGAYALAGLLSSLLYGVGPRDPVSFLLTPAFLLLIVLVASWLPAVRAARVDPAMALRTEG